MCLFINRFYKSLSCRFILLVLFLVILLAGCQLSSPASTAAVILTQPELSTAAPTPPITPAGTALSMQYEITQADNGRTFTYNVTTRFSVFLDSRQYPKDELKCVPDGVIGSISNIPPFQPPQYVVRYETLQAGECTLQDRDFHVTIKVVP